VLYELLAGDPPFTGSTKQAIIAKVLADTPASVRTVRPNVAAHVDAAVVRALAKVPSDRHATAREFADALLHAPSAASIRVRAHARSWRDPTRLVLGAVAIVGVASAVWMASRPPPAPTRFPVRNLIDQTIGSTITITPDGRALLYTGSAEAGRPIMLRPLEPRYVSTVDSGNLAGHLIPIKQLNIELPDLKLFDERVIAGLADTISIIALEAEQVSRFRQRTEVVTVRQLQDEISACRQLLANHSDDSISSWIVLIDSLNRRASDIDDIVNALAHEHGEPSFEELRWWVGALQHQASSWRRDADALVGWGRLLPLLKATTGSDPAAALEQIVTMLDTVPTLADVPRICDNALVQLAVLQQSQTSDDSREISAKLTKALEQSSGTAGDLLTRLSRLSRTCNQIVEEMDFAFLFDDERKLFALPGNHDWYDGLAAFDSLFCQSRDHLLGSQHGSRIGGWRCVQHRSYWAIHLPYDWWLWGVDIQFSKYLDAPQENYFRTMARVTEPGHNIVLCIAEPHWLDARCLAGHVAWARLRPWQRLVFRLLPDCHLPPSCE
jgi:hypothetical protein